MTATFYVGDAVTVMKTFPEKSVDLVISSPPFLALRSYLSADHPDKALEGGSQATPGEYIDWLLDVVEACARVLAPHGSLCFELGDTYAGSGGAGGDYDPGGWREGQEAFEGSGHRYVDAKYERIGYGQYEETHKASIANLHGKKQGGGTGWPLAKSLSLIPETFRWSMVYGHNPFTGRRTEPWRLRNVIRWVRPNPPVGALGDKFRPATSELMVFCKAKDRFFDLDAVREPHQPQSLERKRSTPLTVSFGENPRHGEYGLTGQTVNSPMNPVGAPPLDWWTVNERRPDDCLPSVDDRSDVDCGGSDHLARSEQVDAPPLDWWNIPPGGYVEHEEPTKTVTSKAPSGISKGSDAGERQTWRTEGNGPPLDWWEITAGGFKGAHYAVWPPELLVKPIKAMCPVGGTVLDPFAGTGTTLAVATGHGRDAIGIDLDERNYQLALERVGPLILERGEVGTTPPH